MRAASHHMVRHMISGLALITCREPVLISISNNLKNAFMAALRVRITHEQIYKNVFSIVLMNFP
jgi:CCR4-NOT transcription complex subunit 1